MEFPEILLSIIKDTEEATGFPVEIKEEQRLESPATHIPAHGAMDKNLILIRSAISERGEFLNYAIAHECGHLIRYFKVPSDKRVTVSIKQGAFPVGYDTVGMVLASLPADIEIEKWLYEKYPAFRDVQLDTYRRDRYRDRDRIELDFRSLPEEQFISIHSMMYAYYRSVGTFTGENFVKAYNNFPSVLEKGKVLFGLSKSRTKKWTEGDIEVTSAWKKFLEIDDMFGYKNIEDAYEGFEAVYKL